ncbi:MAG TPA: acyl-CoA desaturase [Roseiflexaceae bacterium]|nr:acyl-CoA desaturase [Roseiflexaceae bacterium]
MAAEEGSENSVPNNVAATLEPACPEARSLYSQEYVELKRLVKQRGLMERQSAYYARLMLLTLVLLGLSLLLLVAIDNLWLQLLNAAFLAFVFTQIGFIGHDIGHRQTMRESWHNIVAGLIFGNLLIGISRGWWVEKHNQHHGHPNQIDMDPDIDFPFLAFSEEQARDTRGLGRMIVRHQAYWLLPLFCASAFSLHGHSVRYLLEGRTKYRFVEISLLIVHYVWYLLLPFYLLGFWPALLFVVINKATFGLYMALVFAPNHKGMPVLSASDELDFMRQQVLTSRNVRPGLITDYLYGGLNYQIEHHLFPGIPRNRLRQAREIVRAMCQRCGIDYYETTSLQSYREIFNHMHAVSAPLRAGRVWSD